MGNEIALANVGSEAGFSLIEVLVAMTVLSLAASVWLGALMSSSTSLRIETLRADAITVAEALSARQMTLPSKTCGIALSSALGVSVSSELCAVSSCADASCAVRIFRLNDEILIGDDDGI